MNTLQWKIYNDNISNVSKAKNVGESVTAVSDCKENSTLIAVGQTECIDTEKAKLVAGLQVKKYIYEQTSEVAEKIKDMLDPTAKMTEEQKSSYDKKVMNKVYSGKKLTQEELRYIKIHYPAMYVYVQRVQIQRQALEERMKHCHSKQEVQNVYSDAMFHISDKDPAKMLLYAAYDDVLNEFKKTSAYEELPETEEKAKNKEQNKKEQNKKG